MTFAMPKFLFLSNGSRWMEAMQNLFAGRGRFGAAHALQTPSISAQPLDETRVDDHSRFARLLEKELDRLHLTVAEREDSEMLDRVRAALYES